MKQLRLWSSIALITITSIYAQPARADITGTWQTSYGEVTLTKGNRHVRGTYKTRARVSGWLEGRVLRGFWVDPASSRIDWQRTPRKLRGKNGTTHSFICEPRTAATSSVWGSGLYTDDSSICGAAAHAGVISARRGGAVDVVIHPGANSYRGSMQNGVETRAWRSWKGSFSVRAGTMSAAFPNTPVALRRCKTSRDGHHYWGQVSFTFNKDRTKLIGAWGYCREAPTRTWNGTYGGSAIPSAQRLQMARYRAAFINRLGVSAAAWDKALAKYERNGTYHPKLAARFRANFLGFMVQQLLGARDVRSLLTKRAAQTIDTLFKPTAKPTPPMNGPTPPPNNPGGTSIRADNRPTNCTFVAVLNRMRAKSPLFAQKWRRSMNDPTMWVTLGGGKGAAWQRRVLWNAVVEQQKRCKAAHGR